MCPKTALAPSKPTKHIQVDYQKRSKLHVQRDKKEQNVLTQNRTKDLQMDVL